MAMNPMQRKANNYLLIGIFSTLVVTGAIIAILFMQLSKLQTEMNKEKTNVANVYVVNKKIKSGETVTEDVLTLKKVSKSVWSADATLPLRDDEGKAREDLIAKIDLEEGMIITANMLTTNDQKTTNDARKQEYNMVILPTQIESGDYIDIRLRLSNGTDFIVVSKKKVEIPQIDGVDSADIIKVEMSEMETKTMAGAIVEAYIDEGAMLYATTYVEPGLQASAIPTYVPSAEVQVAIANDSNVEYEARKALINRYDSEKEVRLNLIERTLNRYDAKEKVDNIEAKVQEEITKAKEARTSYLESLGGY